MMAHAKHSQQPTNNKMLLFLSTLLIITVNGYHTIYCNENTQCQNQHLICNETDHCFITCEGKQSCEGSTFYCPSGSYDCDLNCAESSCHYSTMNATRINGNNGQLDIFCTGSNSCLGSNFHCPSGSADCNLICNGESSCKSVTINAETITGIGGRLKINAKGGNNTFSYSHTICPTSGDCLITTSGAGKTFFRSIIDASHSILGDLNVKHDINSDWNAKGMNVSCPKNGSCIIDCGNAYGACANAYFTAQLTTTQLHIIGEGGRALQYTHITCPQKQFEGFLPYQKNCHIYSIGHYDHSVEYMEIKAIESFQNIQFYGVVSNYDEDKAPIIYCMNDYSQSCKLYKISDTQWQCDNTNSPCNNGIFHTYTPGPMISILDDTHDTDSSLWSHINVNVYVIIVCISTIAILFAIVSCNCICKGKYNTKQQFQHVENHEPKDEIQINENHNANSNGKNVMSNECINERMDAHRSISYGKHEQVISQVLEMYNDNKKWICSTCTYENSNMLTQKCGVCGVTKNEVVYT